MASWPNSRRTEADGTAFAYLSFMGTPAPIDQSGATGGSRPQEAGLGIAVDGAGNTYITGRSEFGIPTVFPPGGALQVRHRPGNDILISKLVTQDLVALALPETAAAGSKVTGTVT